MARRPRIDTPGDVHHVINRGTAQTALYRGNEDRRRFLDALAQIEERFEVEVHALVLMTNHYHLAVRSRAGRLSEAMQWLEGGYARWFNWRHQRVGALYQDRFTSRTVQSGSQFEALVHYVHLNPVEAGLVSDPVTYRWSSLPSHVGRKRAPEWLHSDLVLAGRTGEEFLASMYASRPGLPPPGPRHLPGPAAECELPLVEVHAVESLVARAFGVSADDIHRPTPGTRNPARLAALALASELDGVTAPALCERYGLSNPSSVRDARRRFLAACDNDEHLSSLARDVRSGRAA